MKNSIYSLFTLAILMVSCQKATVPHVTSFQLEVSDYFSGDSIPNFPFLFSGVYTSSYNFNEVTNEYGRFDTIFKHEHETNFDCSPSVSNSYLVAKKTGQVIGGANTALDLELIPLANFSYEFNCNFGAGSIQNVNRQFLFPFTPESNVQAAPESQSQSIPVPTCGYSMNAATIISGTWIITYQKKTSSSAPWVDYADTVTVAPGDYYMYTIDY
jgi:hypothetical protein